MQHCNVVIPHANQNHLQTNPGIVACFLLHRHPTGNHTLPPSNQKQTYPLLSTLNLIIPLHRISITRRHRPTTATASLSRIPIPLITPRPILILMHLRGHRSCRTIALLRRPSRVRVLGHTVLVSVCGAHDHVLVCDGPAFGVLRELVVVGFRELGDDVWNSFLC